MTRTSALIGLVGAAMLTAVVGGQQPSRPALPGPQKVKDNLYVILGSTPGPQFTGGNTGIFITDAGVTVVDTKLSGYGQSLIEKIKTITNKPVVRIINTHTHGDHTGSNEGFPATVDIVAQENTKSNMMKMDAFKGEKAQFLPKKTYKDKMTLGSGKDRIDLYYFGPGHTSGDTFVVYTALRVLQTGDMFAWKDAPLYDRSNGGSGVQHPKTLAKAVATIKDIDTVIPGHSPVTTPADLKQYQQYTADLLAATQAAIKAGKSADEAAAGIDLTSKYPGYRNERVKAAVAAIYAELKP